MVLHQLRHNGGMIYSAPKVKAFRVLVTHNDKYTEKSLDGVVPIPVQRVGNRALLLSTRAGRMSSEHAYVHGMTQL